MSDPFGRALLDHARGERTAPLRQIDGEWERDHPIEQFYFEPRDPEAETTAFLERHLHGPLVDLGAGVGRDVRYFSEQCETVGLERSPHLVTAMEERGVERAVEGDMFALQATFDRDRFASALAVGTQLGLAQSPAGVQSFLADLAYVTRPDATAVVDAYDPTSVDAADLLGYRSEPTPRHGGGSSTRSQATAHTTGSRSARSDPPPRRRRHAGRPRSVVGQRLPQLRP